MAAIDRFLAKIRIAESECWEWIAYRLPAGYGRFYDGHRDAMAHRFAYETWNGPVPNGTTIDHLCRNRCCVNPDHLEAVTHRENLLRGNTVSALNARKTHCPRGHPYDEANTHIQRDGGRICRQCNRDRARAYYAGQRRL
jgi:hypothetical protein